MISAQTLRVCREENRCTLFRIMRANRRGISVLRQKPRESRHSGELPTQDDGEKENPT
jgi:hypothetical protein